VMMWLWEASPKLEQYRCFERWQNVQWPTEAKSYACWGANDCYAGLTSGTRREAGEVRHTYDEELYTLCRLMQEHIALLKSDKGTRNKAQCYTSER
jgi:hypothetical protein